MKIKLAKFISQFLVDNGITDCFMVTGGGAMHLDDAIGHQEGMHCVFNHHEQACSIAAEGYTRMTGKLAAVCVTSGPGGTNAITGVMGGWLDSIPMFVISGQVKRETTTWSCQELGLRQLGDQEFDIINSVSNMTKYAVMLTNPKEVAYHMEKALYLALNGRGGPVWIDVPLDVQGAMIETEELIHFNPAEEKPWQVPEVKLEVVDTILEKIKKAKAPLILVGTGIRLGGAEELLLKLLDKLQIPVVTAWNANDVLAADSPYFAGMPGTVGTRPGNFAIQNCDLLLSLGCRLNIRMIGYNHYDFAKNAYKIIVDIDPRELVKPTIRPDMPVNADVKDLISKMLDSDYNAETKHKKWLVWCQNLMKEYPAACKEYHRNDGGVINPYIFMDKLFDHLNNNDRIICGNGSACVITFQAGKIKQGQRMFTNSGCAAMGYGLPAALGVAVSDNSRRTICIDGDGSIMMNVQELGTVKRKQLPLKIVLLDNQRLGMVRQWQQLFFQERYSETTLTDNPDFLMLASAFGIPGQHITRKDQVEAALDTMLNSDGPYLLHVSIDELENVWPLVPPGASNSEMLEKLS